MTKWEIIDGVRACMDCTYYSANGPGEMDRETVDRVADGFERLGQAATFCPDSDEDSGEWLDYGFTWHPCDVCGLDLGHDYVRGSLSFIPYREDVA